MRTLLLIMSLSTITFGCTSDKAKEPTERASNASDDHHRLDDQATADLQAHRAEQAKVTEAKAAADAVAIKAHAAAQDQVQANFDASDRRLIALKASVADLTGTKKNKANAAVAVAVTNDATAMASIAKLRDASLAQWDAAKAKVDADADALDRSLDAVEVAMQ